MSISAQYSKEVRKNLSYFPCWEPGDSVVPGDVGEVLGGVFHRQTTISELFPGFSVVLGRDAKPNRMMFQSENAVAVKFNAGASVVGVAPGDAGASVDIQFNRGGAVVFQASNCSRRFIKNLHELRQHIALRNEDLPKGYAFVSHVEEAQRFAVFVSGAAGGAISLAGQVDLLQQLQLAEANVTVRHAENIGYQRMGTGPILLRLYGRKFWSSTTTALAGGDPESTGMETDIAEFSPRSAAFD